MNIAIVRDSDDGVRAPDEQRLASEEARRADLRDAALAAGHEICELADCEVAVVMLTHGNAGFTAQLDVPCVAVIHRRSAPDLDHDESDRSVLGTRADAFVLGGQWLARAIEWVAAEDRAARAIGQPRLVVMGTCRDDFGMVRTIPEEPLIIGRAMTFGQHPQRPDRLPTPTGRIARWHARVRNVAGAIAIAYTRSTNGTLVIRHGEPARLLIPQQRHGASEYGPPASPWLVRDPDSEWTALRIGDEIQLPGFWRFRVDGDAGWRPDD